ncbi:MAG: DUF6716 putative glycosyltransferase [Pseudolysinimonas sp.]
MRIVAISDSDSYLKWAGALISSLPPEWESELIVVQTPVMPSASQRQSALALSGIDPESLARLPLVDLPQRLATIRPDAVLVATRGPVARVLIRMASKTDPRPVIVSGLPGISIPATFKALRFRLQADLFVLHSLREIREFTALSRGLGWDHRFALATLPFVEKGEQLEKLEKRGPGPGDTVPGDLVFAAQAVVPQGRADRLRVARLLLDAAIADPTRRVVVKVRAVRGERQTHDELDGYPELLEQLGRLPDNLVVSSEPMSVALDTAEGLMTVSSTAAIEAIARGIPVIALDTFGVSDALINPVFEGSGLFAGEAAVIGREFRQPVAGWLDDNYFHASTDDDLIEQLGELVSARRMGALPGRAAELLPGGRLRLAWDRRRAFAEADRTLSGAVALAVGVPARAAVLLARRIARRTRAVRGERLDSIGLPVVGARRGRRRSGFGSRQSAA